MSMDEKANASLRSLLTIRKGNIATPLLTYINVALFVIMAICGVSLIAPTGISIIKWGADFGPLTLTGDWWRTVTCNFIHIGVIHILMNMYALLYIGVFLEQLIGGRRLISAYLLTGLFSALASLTIHPEIISAGASGSIFGLYGIFLSYLIFHHKIEKGQRKSLLYSIGFFVFYNLTSGIRVENIDNAAHIGGLISGVVLGILYLLTDRYAVKKASTLCTSLTEISFVLIFAFLFVDRHPTCQQILWKSERCGIMVHSNNMRKTLFSKEMPLRQSPMLPSRFHKIQRMFLLLPGVKPI